MVDINIGVVIYRILFVDVEVFGDFSLFFIFGSIDYSCWLVEWFRKRKGNIWEW